ncbi:MAG: hypothetical protein ACKVW3_14590 [Phycisphaerales bacterium]
MRTFTSVAAVVAFAGSALGQFQALVVDFSGSRVARYEWPSGTPVNHMVANGISTLSGARGSALGTAGDLFVTSYNTDTVLRFDGQTGQPRGIFVTAASGGLNGPTALAFGPDGNLYVASSVNDLILKYDGQTGTLLSTFSTGPQVDQPEGIAFGPDNNLYVCSYLTDTVARFNGFTGAFIDFAITAGQSGLNGPAGVLFDAGGRMYVSGGLSNSVIVKDPVAGVSVLATSATAAGMTTPYHMAIAPDGTLCVAAFGSGAITRLNRTTGAYLGNFLQPGAGGISADPWAILFVSGGCYANCDGSTVAPALNVADFVCYLNKFAAGCS